jgi:hypothetical protein
MAVLFPTEAPQPVRGNGRCGAGRAIPNAKLSDREGSNPAVLWWPRERPESARMSRPTRGSPASAHCPVARYVLMTAPPTRPSPQAVIDVSRRQCDQSTALRATSDRNARGSLSKSSGLTTWGLVLPLSARRRLGAMASLRVLEPRPALRAWGIDSLLANMRHRAARTRPRSTHDNIVPGYSLP